MESSRPDIRRPPVQRIVLGGAVVLFFLLLGIGYFLFLRTDYVVLAQGLRTADVAALVGELDKHNINYRLRDGGTTILVPEGQADTTRVAIAGSEVAARGQVGFELFNKSDMGLTNFAQKINYQRALQGELVRTIMAIDGVENARVHLSLPEKSLFRGDRVEPRAAVTITTKPGEAADPARVQGIQQLVAAAVPDLPEARVVVLDAAGHVISAAVAAGSPTGLQGRDRPADIAERAALEDYYRARARGAIERRIPGLRFTLRVLLLPSNPAAGTADGSTGSTAADWAPSGEGPQRNFRMRVVVVTLAQLGGEDQQIVREAIANATGLSEQVGDSVAFETGPVDAPVPASAVQHQPTLSAAPMAPNAAPAGKETAGFAWPPIWTWLIAAIALGCVLVWRFRSAQTTLDSKAQQAFADRLRRQMHLAGEADDVAA
ncbi:flagellar basal-body MS-ring/collar protein FliF [Sphingomonas elodea]|uniref:flagellar basal-body MS-ring/collar protein FliF n=1 Tax=Sphingomonas elodea TaxID=179878 RepID=UPI0002631382|nr:flagellar basal-body MS-ring/collar protein FliF [Sphingomonas elodea]